MSTLNPDCDGAQCVGRGEVRVLPLGGGGNLILCRICFGRENAYRAMRGKECGRVGDWPVVAWECAEVYAA